MSDIIEALSAVMDDVQAVKKADKNTHQNFMFRGIDAVVNAVGPALRKHGVVVVPTIDSTHYEQVQTSTGKPSTACRVEVTYTFHASGCEPLPVSVAAEAWDSGDKATPKAMSVAFRTALLQALCLPTDEPDPDAQTYERAPAPSLKDELAALDQVIAEAKDAGLDGDYDATREWAGESVDNARQAAGKLRRAIADKGAA